MSGPKLIVQPDDGEKPVVNFLKSARKTVALKQFAHESDLSVANEVTQARVMEALKVGAETYEGELEMDYMSRLSATG